MCGITGIVKLKNIVEFESGIEEMTQSLYHRGPDFGDVVKFSGCHLGHRRLSIIDLNSSSNQPFKCKNNRYFLVYNGEIYNYRELKADLIEAGIEFRTESDTEVLLEAFLYFGKKVIEHLNGIFAFAVWDNRDKTLFAARDHIGVKPFYYCFDEEQFIFASEIKAMASEKSFNLNKSKVFDFLQYGAVFGEETLFEGIKRLPPGSFLTVENGNVNITEYYCSFTSAEKQVDSQKVDSLLMESIKLQMVSDVPVGTMCSGGVDSSLISAVSSKYSEITLNAYGIKIPYEGYDESKYAIEVANHSKLHYNEFQFDAKRAGTLLKTLIWLHDEPLRHPNSVPIFEVSRLAREKVIVLLSGEGADEIFGGYGVYQNVSKLKLLSKLPSFLIKMMLFFSKIKGGRGKQLLLAALNKNTAKGLLALRSNETDREIEGLLNYPQKKDSGRKAFMDKALVASGGDEVNALMYFDQYAHLQTLLDRQDKMCMGNSIESRVPFLDYRLISCLNEIKSSEKIRAKQTKVQLREIARAFLPESIFNRPKYPFGVPLFEQYLDDPNQQEYLYKMPDDSPLVKEGVLNPDKLRKILNEFSKGSNYNDDLVWNILNLDIWYRIYIKKELKPDLEQLPAYSKVLS